MKNNYPLSNRNQPSLWRFLFTIVATLCCGHGMMAQQCTIPANNSFTATSNRPAGAFYGYDRTLSIYTASEMNIASGSMITGIRYFVQTAPAPATLPVFVYMKNIPQSSYNSGIYNTGLIGATLVYGSVLEGSSVSAGRWVTFNFPTPFEYTGANIQILVGSNISDDPGQGTVDKTFRWSPGSNQTQVWNSNIQATFPSNGVVMSTKPNIQILYNTAGATGPLSLDYPALTMLENRTQLIAVNRSGGSAGAVSVNYATSDGTAVAGIDYTATSGTLNWADGDMEPKSFTLTTLPDFIQDDAETINITLSDAVGTTIESTNPAVVTITDVLPPMRGTYTVGVGGNYPSLTNAGGLFQALNNRVDGISGPVTINIISDLTGETGVNALNEIPGGYPVLIQPFGAARTITGTLNNTSNLGLLRFEGTDNVTINGSLTAATAAACQIGGDASLRQLTIVNNSIGTTTAVLFQSGTTGSYNNTLKNVNLVGYGPSSGYGVMFRVFPHSSSFPSLVNNQNSRVENCSFRKANIGIYSAGSTTTNPNSNLVVTGNDISATGTDRVSRNAVFIANETNAQVTFNKVNIMNTSSDSSETVGLAIGASQAYATSVTSGGISGALVANNWITGVTSTVDLGGSTAGIAISGTAFGTPNVVRNNMISNVAGLSQFTYNVAGIWVVGAVASETKLYHNTVSLYGDRGSRTNQSPSYGIAISGLDPNVEMRNNIVSTTQIATGGGFVKTYAFGTLSTTFANLVSDHNIFYSGGVQDGGFRSGSLSNNAGTSYATLADWTAATGKDGNSVEVAPVFVAPTDLHLAAGSNPVIEATPGLPIASVTTDMDCNPRSTTAPAIGAQEINVSGHTISAAAGTGGTINPPGTTLTAVGANQSYAITANCGYTIADVLVDGVSQGAIATYTFTNIGSNHTITATFSSQAPTITANGPTTFCPGGSVVLTSSALTGNVWSTGETTQSITAAASGNYTVWVNDGSCPTAPETSLMVTIAATAPAPTITVAGNLTFCQGLSVTLTSSALTGNVWSNGATTRAITVTTSGSYTVTTNNGSCTSLPSQATVVTVNPLAPTPTITASGPTAICQGSQVVLTASAGSSYNWSNGATTQSITVSAAGSYTVRVSNGTCNSPLSEATVVTVNPIPARPTISVSGPLTFCAGGSVTLTSSAATGNIWSNGETTPSITVSESGVYTVTRTADGCTSTPSLARTVTVNPLPATPTIAASGPTTFCQGGNVVLTSSVATGNLWSTGATTASISVSTSGAYTVTSTSGGCTSLPSAATTVTVNAIGTTPTISASGATTFCQGGNVVLTSSSATGNTWSNGATTQSITVSTSGTYTVSVNDGGCASGTSAGTIVTVNALPVTPTISASGATTFCQGGNVVLTSSSATGNTWSNGATTQSITVSASGNYSVLVDNGSCASATSAATIVMVNALPVTPTISASGATTFCQGGTVVLTSSSATGNVWSNGATTQSITVSASGNYSVLVDNGSCASATSAATIVTVNALPVTPTISASGATTFCQGGTVVLTSSSATGNVWSNGATTQSITVSASGNYSVLVDNGDCASATAAATSVTVNALPVTPTISASGATTFCQGGTVVLTSSSATGNVWSNGATTQSITVSTSGDYTVLVDNGNCASATAAATIVTVNALPVTPTISASGATTFCQGGTVVLTSSSATGNVWSNGATTQSITVSTSGNYSVLVDNGNCTSATAAATSVTVNALPVTPTISASGATTFCQGGTVVLTSSSATGNVWSNGATTQSITVSASGNYSVLVDNGSCASATSAATIVTVNALPVTPTISASGATTFCQGGTVVLTSSSATGNVWSNGATTQSITVSASGNYSVLVDNGNCTSATAAATIVTVNEAPAIPTISASGALSFCAGGQVTLTSSSATGNVWSTGETTASIVVTEAGNYAVLVNNGSCTSGVSAVTAVAVNALPDATVTQVTGLLSATQAGATYQWFQCPDIAIAGAVDQNFVPTQLGDYKVVVTLGTCEATSECITVNSLANLEFVMGSAFSVYPNPVSDIVNIEYTGQFSSVSLFNMLGQQLLSKKVNASATQMDMAHLPAGTYFVKVAAERGSYTTKVIKN